MRRLAISLGGVMLLLATTALAQALFDKGANAYKRGDYETALAVFRPLAENGDPKAQSILALMYSYGEGVPVDFTEAARWYRRAAEQNSNVAQYNLGMLYAEGKGVPQDTDEAIFWLTKAADGGHFRARNELARLDAGAYSALDSPAQDSLEAPPTVATEAEPRSVVLTKREPTRRSKPPVTTSPTTKVVMASAPQARSPEPVNNHTAAPASKAPESEPAPTTVAPAAPAARAAPAGAAYRVQLAASRSEENIRRDWSSYQQRYGDIFAGLDGSVERAEVGEEKTVWYRLRVGPFASAASARELCEKLSERGVKTGCLPLRVSR